MRFVKDFTLTARDTMTKMPLITAKKVEQHLEEAAEIMHQHKIEKLPIS
jgi:IMP dehydrogenase